MEVFQPRYEVALKIKNAQMFAEVTEAINLLDVELVKRDFFQCRQYAVIMFGPLHDSLVCFRSNCSVLKKAIDQQHRIGNATLRTNSSVIFVMSSCDSGVLLRSTKSVNDC